MWSLGRVGQRVDRGSRNPRTELEIYEEAAFRHFLSLERRRAERRGRTLLLLLVDLNATYDAAMTTVTTAFEVTRNVRA